jgi:hypothetical protein
MPQAVMLEDLDGIPAVKRSSRLVRGRWWHTALFAGVVNIVLGGAGLVVGLILLVAFTGLPLWTLSVAITVVSVFVMPLGAIAMTLLYGDAVAERRDAELARDEAAGGDVPAAASS